MIFLLKSAVEYVVSKPPLMGYVTSI